MRILCYGDSNTYGYIPGTGERYADDVRWPGVLKSLLGSGHVVIEEGLNSRTTVWEDPIDGPGKNGRTYLTPCLQSHAPLDVVILMLGTNDLKMRFSVTPYDIATGVETLIEDIKRAGCGKNGATPRILVVCPTKVYNIGMAREIICQEGAAKSEQLPEYYRLIAERNGVDFMLAGDFAEPSAEDGMHWTPEGHRAMANGVLAKLREMQLL